MITSMNLRQSALSGDAPTEETVSGTDATINHSLGHHPATIQILDSDGVEQGKSQFEVKKVTDSQFTVDFIESVTNWTIRYK